jgi:phosphoribosylformylglycinamidine synthase subunit PurL
MGISPIRFHGTVNKSTNNASDAAIVKIKGSAKSLALTVDCNSRFVYADPEKGTAIAVSEAARNIVCSGGTPCAITNCLNFGNPYDKGVFWQFAHAILGMKSACEKFKTPVTGGNVSFYNQSSDGIAVYPTPTIGMIGIVEKEEHITTIGFKNLGDTIFLLGPITDDIGSSQYVAKYHKVEFSNCAFFDLELEFNVQASITSLIRQGMVNSCHDVSEGGLFVTLMESSFNSGFGFDIECPASYRKDAFLFGEGQSRAIISVSPENAQKVMDVLKTNETHCIELGRVAGNNFTIDDEDFGSIDSYKETYENALPSYLDN